MRWALSLRDWRSHAVKADQPDEAVCGHRLMATSGALHDGPVGAACGRCVALALASLHGAHLAGALAQLPRLYGVTGRLRALAGEAPGLDLAQLRARLRALVTWARQGAQ